MRIDRHPPEGSAITMSESYEGYRYTWPTGGSGGIANVGVTVFLLFWLVGWALGESFAINALLDGEMPGPGSLFLIVWLGAWTVGGLACMATVYLNLRPLRPAVLLLGQSEIVYESGTRRPDMKVNDRRNTNFLKVFEGTKNRVHRIPVREVRNLELERVGERLRLSLDYQSSRIEIGRGLGEPDKEWLHRMLEPVVIPS